jgi:hypothetical protein
MHRNGVTEIIIFFGFELLFIHEGFFSLVVMAKNFSQISLQSLSNFSAFEICSTNHNDEMTDGGWSSATHTQTNLHLTTT